MSKGEQTREMILERAAPVFNQMGYGGTALSDIMAATGLEKGGIYNHFQNKEQLAIESFDWAIRQVGRAMLNVIRGRQPGLEQLAALVSYFSSYYLSPPVPGGCPIMNTSVDSDDGNPVLREHARQGMNQLRRLVQSLIVKGIEQGSIRPDISAENLADLLVASLEGGLMLSKLYNDPAHINRMVSHLLDYIELNVRQ
jgi:TetR/AcrR family transcriptional regulator, transcriptional repressor for nem operon